MNWTQRSLVKLGGGVRAIGLLLFILMPKTRSPVVRAIGTAVLFEWSLILRHAFGVYELGAKVQVICGLEFVMSITLNAHWRSHASRWWVPNMCAIMRVSYWVLASLKHKLVIYLIRCFVPPALIEPYCFSLYSAQIFSAGRVLTLNQPNRRPVWNSLAPPFLPMHTSAVDIDRDVAGPLGMGVAKIRVSFSGVDGLEVADNPTRTPDSFVLIFS